MIAPPRRSRYGRIIKMSKRAEQAIFNHMLEMNDGWLPDADQQFILNYLTDPDDLADWDSRMDYNVKGALIDAAKENPDPDWWCQGNVDEVIAGLGPWAEQWAADNWDTLTEWILDYLGQNM